MDVLSKCSLQAQHYVLQAGDSFFQEEVAPMHSEHIYWARCLWSVQCSIDENLYAFGIGLDESFSEGAATPLASPWRREGQDPPADPPDGDDDPGADEGDEESGGSPFAADDITLLAHRPLFRSFLAQRVPFNLPR